MKKNFVAILAVLIVVDLIALGVWWKHRQKTAAAPEAAPAVMTPSQDAPPPPPTTAEAEPMTQAPGAPPETPDPTDYSMNLFGPGISPGGCSTIEACEEYCMKPENERECLEWTQGDQTKKRKERELADATAPVDPTLVGGMMPADATEITPGDCRGRACASYCRKKEHREECIDYCANPKNHKACRSWGPAASNAVKSALSGALVSDEAILDEEAYEVLENGNAGR